MPVRRCGECGKFMGDRGRSKLCSLDCSMRRAIEVQRQLHAKEGPWFERWKMGCLLSAPKARRRDTVAG